MKTKLRLALLARVMVMVLGVAADGVTLFDATEGAVCQLFRFARAVNV